MKSKDQRTPSLTSSGIVMGPFLSKRIMVNTLEQKKSGHLYANCDDFSEDRSKYYFYLINRPVLVLKCDQGFVGYKSSNSSRLECNKASYETILVDEETREWFTLKV